MNLYIAGPMGGMPQLNYPLFFETEKQLRALGHAPINPARIDSLQETRDALATAISFIGSAATNNRTWEYYMPRDIPRLLQVDGICLLPGWQRNQGSRVEVMIATAAGKSLYALKNDALLVLY